MVRGLKFLTLGDDGTGYIRNLLCGTNGGITSNHKKMAADIIKDAMPNLAVTTQFTTWPCPERNGK